MTEYLIGLDEVGRGCLAGDVVTAGVLVPVGLTPVSGVKDSKQMTYQQREKAAAALRNCPDIQYAIQTRTVADIDRLGIGKAVTECFLALVQELLKNRQPRVPVKEIIVDGVPIWEPNRFSPVPTVFLPKADATVWAVSAASVIAKVTRDHYIERLDAQFPAYGWERNKGYGTKEHILALKEHGLTPHHRAKFCGSALKNLHPTPPPAGEILDIDALFEMEQPTAPTKKWQTDPAFDLPGGLLDEFSE